jgi:hypothetical protein
MQRTIETIEENMSKDYRIILEFARNAGEKGISRKEVMEYLAKHLGYKFGEKLVDKSRSRLAPKDVLSPAHITGVLSSLRNCGFLTMTTRGKCLEFIRYYDVELDVI